MTCPPSQCYFTEKKLGEGAYGIVHLVKHKQTGDMRVMKVVNKAQAMQGGTPLAMLKQEINTLMLLDHPHILKLFEYFVDSSNFYLIMDLVPGGELLDVVEKKVKESGGAYLDEGWVATIFEQVLQSVSYCHAKGVMHKDL